MRNVSRLAPTFALAVAAGLLAIAVPAAGQATAPATPQAALDALEAANTKGDARAVMALITPDGQKRLAKETVNNGLMLLLFADPDDPNPMGPKPTGAELEKKRAAFKQVKASITAALKPAGLDAAIGKPLMPAQEIVDKHIDKADPNVVVPAILDAAIKAGPDLGMKGGAPKLMRLEPFSGLKVDGDHATVKSGPRTVKIDKVGGKWLIDLPLPEPKEPPQ
jgi:hypothetical protein